MIRWPPLLAALVLLSGCASAASRGVPAAAEPTVTEPTVTDAVAAQPTPGRLQPPLPEISAAHPVDDAAMRDRFSKAVEALHAGGEAVEPSVLREQMGARSTCRLELPAARAAALTTETLFARCRSSAVLVGNLYNCGRCSRWHAGMASGFAIGPDVVVTNHHVMANDQAAAFAVMSASGQVYPVAEVLAASEAGDAAIVRISIPQGAEPLAPVPIAAHAPVGARVAVISHPTDQFFTLTEGIVSRYAVFREKRQGPASVRMTITADYAKGSSGAPVLDARGNVCGMVSSTSSIYYDRDTEGRQRNLQMVIRTCVPSAVILGLIERPGADSRGLSVAVPAARQSTH